MLHEVEDPLTVFMFWLNIHYSLRTTHLEKMGWAAQMLAGLVKINEFML